MHETAPLRRLLDSLHFPKSAGKGGKGEEDRNFGTFALQGAEEGGAMKGNKRPFLSPLSRVES